MSTHRKENPRSEKHKEMKTTNLPPSSPPRGKLGGDASCRDVQEYLLQLHQPGRESLPAPLAVHAADCKACQTFRSQLLLIDDLAREQAPELPAGFQLALHRKLYNKARTEPARAEGAQVSFAPSRWVRIALATAAAILLAVGALTLFSYWQSGRARPPTYHQLHLSIQSTKDYEKMRFDIRLPEGTRLLPLAGSLLGQGTLSWQSPIHQGINEIDLPLVAQQVKGKVVVQLNAGNESWTGTVLLDAQTATSSSERNEDRHHRLAWALDPRGESSRGGQ